MSSTNVLNTPESLWPDWMRRLFWGPETYRFLRSQVTMEDAHRLLQLRRATEEEDQLRPLVEADLAHARQRIEAMRQSIMQMFGAMSVAIAFIVPGLVDRAPRGGIWVNLALLPVALLCTTYAGTLFGVLLINNNLEVPRTSHGHAAVDAARDADRSPLGTRFLLLLQHELAVEKLRIGFHRMVRVGWYALFSWMLLAVFAGLGHKVG